MLVVGEGVGAERTRPQAELGDVGARSVKGGTPS